MTSFEKGRSLFDLIGFKDVVEELLNKSVDVVTEQSVHESIFFSLAGIEDPLSDKGSFRHVPCPIMQLILIKLPLQPWINRAENH